MADKYPVLNNKLIGEKIRLLRKSRQFTIDKFSKSIGLSKSYLSQIENGQSNITVSLVKKICNGFDISITELLYPNQMNEIIISRLEERNWVLSTKRNDILQSPVIDDQTTLSAWVMKLHPHSDAENNLLHRGEEMTLVLSGKIKIYINSGGGYTLEKGDMLFYSAEKYHSWSNPFDQVAEIFIVSAPIN